MIPEPNLDELLGCRPLSVERLGGGSRKGVYRLGMPDGSTKIAYSWAQTENFWPQLENDGAHDDPFTAGVGFDLFQAAHSRLASLGLRVPEVYAAGRDLAVVEDFPRGSLEDLLQKDRRAATLVLERLAEALAVMRQYQAPAYGRVAWIDTGHTSRERSCETATLEFGLRCLAEAAGRDQRVADTRDRIERRLRELVAVVQPRVEYSVVHGELGFGHVMVTDDGLPVLIDIEDLMYFDVEWEHVFLRIGPAGAEYSALAVAGLDEDRIAFYLLTQRLSLVAGPLRLLEGDFPNRAFMRSIIENNLAEMMTLL